jgi:hypothetical protein
MPLTEEDATRLEKLGHAAGAAEDPDGRARPLWTRAAFSRIADDGTGELRLQNVSGAFFFLKNDRCSVYADRPAGCRTYPFVLTPQGKLVRDEDCPWRREFAQPPGVQRRLIQITGTVAREAAQR